MLREQCNNATMRACASFYSIFPKVVKIKVKMSKQVRLTDLPLFLSLVAAPLGYLLSMSPVSLLLVSS